MYESVCAFVLEGLTFSYCGELVEETTDKVVLKNVLVRLTKPKQVGDQTVADISYMRVPFSGKESTVHLDLRSTRGFLVKDIDDEDKEEYRKVFTKLHSKLHMV